jgi:hypothetical protein
MIEDRTLVFEAAGGSFQLPSHFFVHLLDKESFDHLDELHGEVTEAPVPEPMAQA